MWKRRPFHRTLRGVADSGGAEDIADSDPPPGVRYVYQQALVENETSSAGTCRLGINQVGIFDLVGFANTFTVDVPQRVNEHPIGVEGDRSEHLEARFAGATAADVLVLSLAGFAEVWDPG